MEPFCRRRDQCRVVSLKALDHLRDVGTHGGVVAEQFVVEPCLEDAALGRVEVGDIALPALQRVDEGLDLLCSARGDQLLGLGSKRVAGGDEVRPEVGLGSIVLIRRRYDVVNGAGVHPVTPLADAIFARLGSPATMSVMSRKLSLVAFAASGLNPY